MAILEKKIICPYCEDEFEDSGEYGEEDNQIDCGGCGNQFNLSVNITRRYSTSKVSCSDREPKQEHVWLTDSMRCVEVTEEDIIKFDLITKVPYFLWMRKCQNCDYEEIKQTENVINPFLNKEKNKS